MVGDGIIGAGREVTQGKGDLASMHFSDCSLGQDPGPNSTCFPPGGLCGQIPPGVSLRTRKCYDWKRMEWGVFQAHSSGFLYLGAAGAALGGDGRGRKLGLGLLPGSATP